MEISGENCPHGAGLPDPFPIRPLRGPLHGVIRVPGSKSITNRALVLAALSPGEVRLEGVLFSRDTHLMMDALRALGIGVDADTAKATAVVHGCGGAIPSPASEIRVGNAGTAARMLTALVCLREGGCFRFSGDEEMERRPMVGLLNALVEAGWAEVEYHGRSGHFPYTLHTCGIRDRRITVDPSESSQMLSALLITAAGASGRSADSTSKSEVCVAVGGAKYRRSYVDMTLSMLQAFGATVVAEDGPGSFLVEPGLSGPEGGRYVIEPDASSASYFAALPLVIPATFSLPGFTRMPGMQGDLGLLSVLKACGLEFSCSEGGLNVRGDGAITRGLAHNFYEISDTFLTLAALAPLFPAPLEISGIGHTRLQETDRVAGMAKELAKLGVEVREEKDRLLLKPNLDATKQLALEASPLIISTYKDHRFAMSFAVLGCFDLRGDGQPWLAIQDPHCTGKTFPNFFELLSALNP